MSKNLIIAFLLGIVLTSAVKADTTNTITREDLFEAAALCGVLANEAHDPFGAFSFVFFRQPSDFITVSRAYAKEAVKK